MLRQSRRCCSPVRLTLPGKNLSACSSSPEALVKATGGRVKRIGCVQESNAVVKYTTTYWCMPALRLKLRCLLPAACCLLPAACCLLPCVLCLLGYHSHFICRPPHLGGTAAQKLTLTFQISLACRSNADRIAQVTFFLSTKIYKPFLFSYHACGSHRPPSAGLWH